MGVFPHLRPPKIFFQKSGSVTFVPLWCTNFMQKFRKILRAVSEIFKDGPTDHGRTDMSDYIGASRVNPGSKNILQRPFEAKQTTSFRKFSQRPQPRWGLQETLILVDTYVHFFSLSKIEIGRCKKGCNAFNIFDLEVSAHSLTLVLQTLVLHSISCFLVGIFFSTPPLFFFSLFESYV